jgi:lysyl-tRNA synthetase class 2
MPKPAAAPAPTVEDALAVLPDLDADQVRKVVALGKKAWPYRFPAERDLAALRARLEAAHQPGQKGDAPGAKRYKVAGRLRAKRGSGGIAFLDLEGQDGKIQCILDKGELGDAAFDAALHLLNEGDWVGVAGYGMRSKRGEPSIGAEKVTLLAKALVSFPDLGQAEAPELRYGRPYVGLMQGPAARRPFVQRARITQVVRQVLEKAGFLEAHIPVLEKVYGGANAQPFVTHSNAKDMPMYLRISHELALKKLLVGGLERVHHIGPAFRNEDIDTTHNPEFTLLECYAAYWDYTDMMRLTEKMFQAAVKAVNGGSLVLQRPGKEPLDFGTFHVVTMKDAIRSHGGPDPDTVSDEEIQKILAEANVHIRGGYSRGLGVAKLFEVYAEPLLVQPTFVIDHPRETTPLCKAHRKDPSLVERFELFIAGREHANSYSELNDPILQARLFAEQEARRKGGDDEAPPTDQDFIQALKHGMPPAGGLGVGIDRMVMTLLDLDSIKQVLPFPQMK